ncbi:unnamed protein product [Lymnaea stagnalis]|uniref:Uncharacterized protein n=1 Tax=Lymnaea stagnalis TaxID=6523 RepID=A0AAV2I9T1_LYMST
MVSQWLPGNSCWCSHDNRRINCIVTGCWFICSLHRHTEHLLGSPESHHQSDPTAAGFGNVKVNSLGKHPGYSAALFHLGLCVNFIPWISRRRGPAHASTQKYED